MSETKSEIASNDDNVEALIDAWKLMVGRLPNHTIEQSDGVATIFGHVPLTFLNVSILDRPFLDASDFSGALKLASARAKACRHVSVVGFCTAWAPADWANVVAEAGLELSLNMTGMATDRLLPARREAPALKYRLATDVATASDLAAINAHAYGMPVERVECISNLHLWQENSFGVVGYAGGRAVTCTATFVVADMIYVALVATLPDAHGQGYAESAMRHAIKCAQEANGLKRMWLHASDMGRPLYRSMGFETGAELPLFAFSEGPAAH